jgi:hypothetical protein
MTARLRKFHEHRLRNCTSHRLSEYRGTGKPEMPDERCSVGSHVFDRKRSAAVFRAADSAIIEDHDLEVPLQRRQHRTPKSTVTCVSGDQNKWRPASMDLVVKVDLIQRCRSHCGVQLAPKLSKKNRDIGYWR